MEKTNSRRKETMEITKVVLTGGPCAGKTSGLSGIQERFTQMGYTVIVIAETATELIKGGSAPWLFDSAEDFQTCLVRMQLAKEKIYEEAARKMGSEKVLIVCDRGALDNKAYMSDEEFSNVLTNIDMDEISLRDNYDAVFHLVTAANGAEEFYNTANNAARTETPQQARELDDKLISAWTGHPHLRVIDNAMDFDDKMRRLMAEIAAFLGEPEPMEIERKYLIEYPDIEKLESMPNCQRVEIIQTYLNSSPDEEVRVRQRGMDGHYVYFQATKRKVTELQRVETERRLSKDEYLRLLMDADINRRQIRKTRYCLTENNQYFEIDVYPFWDDKAIMEIELSEEGSEIVFPENIKIIKEVTFDESYKNASIASDDTSY